MTEFSDAHATLAAWLITVAMDCRIAANAAVRVGNMSLCAKLTATAEECESQYRRLRKLAERES